MNSVPKNRLSTNGGLGAFIGSIQYYRGSIGNMGKNPIWGLPGSRGNCSLIFNKSVDRKLHGTILFHIGLVFVKSHFPQTHFFIFMISDILDMSMTFKTNYA